MGRVMSVANQKGGVGKTTTALNLAVGLALAGSRTLLVDLDPQCNATTGLNQTPTDRHGLLLDIPLRQSVVATDIPEMELLPGSRNFEDVALLAGGREGRRVEDRLADGLLSFDFVIVDCPPSVGKLTQVALSTSNEVLMPIQCEYFAMEGLTRMIEVIRNIMVGGKGKLEFGGIVLTMYDHQLELTQEVENEVREFFGEIVFDTVIPRDVAVSESPSHGKSVIDYAPDSRGARAYIELCMEVLGRE